MPDFSLSHRYDSPYWYVSFKNALTKRYGTKKSTGTADKQEAVRIAYEMLYKARESTFETVLEALRSLDLTPSNASAIIDILTKKKLIGTILTIEDVGAESLSAFLKRFWDYDSSPYIKEKLHKNHSIHKKYVKANHYTVERFWVPFFGDTPIAKVTKGDLNELMDSLDPALSGARRNTIFGYAQWFIASTVRNVFLPIKTASIELIKAVYP